MNFAVILLILNQACTGQRMPSFLVMLLFMIVCMCVCVSVSAPRLLITSGMMWTPYDWVNKFYSFYMATAFVIGCSRHGLRIEAHRGN